MKRSPAASAALPPLPPDVRLMNGVAAAIVVVAVLLVFAAALRWIAGRPMFAIHVLVLQGELTRINIPTLRANALPELSGGFFGIDLQHSRAVFEAVPWVRHAVVRRVWPDRLVVTLQAHRAVALWQGDDASALLVGDRGELFHADAVDVDSDKLPLFAGPAPASATMWSLARRLQPMLARRDLVLQRLELTSRGTWLVQTESGQELVLGRGSEDEIAARVDRFVRTLPQLQARWPERPLVRADLRHGDGYAVKLRGLTTTQPAESPADPG